jgi:endonuclease III
MLVGCVFLNLTTRQQVDKVWQKFFGIYPYPLALVNSGALELEQSRRLLEPLGLVNKRMVTLRRLSADYIAESRLAGDDPHYINLTDIYGCGQYAKDSWQIFVLKDFTISPEDHALREWLDARKTTLGVTLETTGVTP